MPLTRPAEISDKVSLSDKVRGAVSAFVTEDSAIDTCLTGGIEELAPDEEGVAGPRSEDDFLPWTREQASSASVFVLVCGIMSFIEFQAGAVAVLGDPPQRLRSAFQIWVLRIWPGFGFG
ncbi:hypothetical protein [Ruegeria sp. EL01]|uniref:hypothetical protein n=1 Tax=Ruegeria sp. EL01 TaxID=2107578 RepID=UPI000EA826BB|nr:hypothetical protein [Ruegeria sp. EL01]